VSRFVHERPEIQRYNHEMALRQRAHLDWLGVLLLSGGLVALEYLLEEGSRRGWLADGLVLACAVAAPILLAAFVARELSARAPAVDLTLFRDRDFLSATAIGAVMYAGFMALTFLLPVFVQELMGFSATNAGLLLMPRALAMMLVIPVAGRLYARISPRSFLAIGTVLATASALLMSGFTLRTDRWTIVAVVALQGIGFACLFVPLTTAALARIPLVRLADAAGLNTLFRQIGGSLGLSILGTVLPAKLGRVRAALAEGVAVVDGGSHEWMDRIRASLAARGLDPAAVAAGTRRAVAALVGRHAAALTFEQLFFEAGLALLLILPLTAFLSGQAGRFGGAVTGRRGG
jgi:DHA2 family multidrug resistance protein